MSSNDPYSIAGCSSCFIFLAELILFLTLYIMAAVGGGFGSVVYGNEFDAWCHSDNNTSSNPVMTKTVKVFDYSKWAIGIFLMTGFYVIGSIFISMKLCCCPKSDGGVPWYKIVTWHMLMFSDDSKPRRQKSRTRRNRSRQKTICELTNKEAIVQFFYSGTFVLCMVCIGSTIGAMVKKEGVFTPSLSEEFPCVHANPSLIFLALIFVVAGSCCWFIFWYFAIKLIKFLIPCLLVFCKKYTGSSTR